MTFVCLKCFELAAIFAPLFGQWISLKPNPVKTSDPVDLEGPFFESCPLVIHPSSQRWISLVLSWHVAVTLVCLECLKLVAIFAPLFLQWIGLKPNPVKTSDPVRLESPLF